MNCFLIHQAAGEQDMKVSNAARENKLLVQSAEQQSGAERNRKKIGFSSCIFKREKC